MTKPLPKIVVILGPTASGKTALSVKLAKKFKGEIVSADSRQIYKYLDLGTGKITKKEMQGVKHHMLNIALPSKKYSSAKFQKNAQKTLTNIAKSEKLPFLVGGSSFYLYPIIQGWQFPKTKADWKLRQELKNKSAQELLEILEKLDPERAETIEKQNPRRLIRAIEIAKQLGSVPQIKHDPQFECLVIGIKREGDELKNLIRKRLIKRLKDGMLKEVEKLLKKKILSIKRAKELGLEYKWLTMYLTGEVGYEEMIERLTAEIWQFSRRQMNWFKKDNAIHWVAGQKEAEKLIKEFI